MLAEQCRRFAKPEMSAEAFDAAISFLVRDERTAAAVAERLEGAGLFSHTGRRNWQARTEWIRCARRFLRLA